MSITEFNDIRITAYCSSSRARRETTPASHLPHPTPQMSSKPSKAIHTTPVEGTAVITPRAPQDIVDEVLDYLTVDPHHTHSLRSCSLVSKSWVPPCRRHLFHTIRFTSKIAVRWLKMFPVPEESPTHHVRHLHLSFVKDDRPPKQFFEHMPRFTEKVTLLWDMRASQV